MRTFGLLPRWPAPAWGFAAVVFGLAYAPPASAQFFLQTETATTFTPLAALPGITAVTDFAFTSRDEGNATLTLPFAFRYLGTPYTDLEISVNGQLGFGGGFIGSYNNRGIGDPSGPDNLIAVWWDDLIIPDAAGHSSHGILGTAPNRIFVIEVRDWEHFGLDNINDGRYQVWLYEGALGRFEVRYDRLLNDIDVYSATAGWQGDLANGGPYGEFRPCSAASPYCGSADYAGLAGRSFRVEQAQGPELLGSVGDFGRGGLPGQTVDVPVRLQNVGTVDAANVTSELYLSRDATLDPATDTRVATFVAPQVDLAGGTVDLTVPATVPPGLAPGDYYLLLSVDAPNTITEPSEQNNVVAATTRFATAYQLTPTVIDSLVGALPGQALQASLTVSNLGVPFVGAVQVQVVASVDRTIDAQDVVLGPVSVTLSGAPSEQVSLQLPIPLTLPPGGYYAIAVVDPAGVLPQLDPNANRLASDETFPTAVDLNPRQVIAPAGATPGGPLNLQLVLDNPGLAYSGPITIRFIASPDPIYDLNDTFLGETTLTTSLVAGASVTVPVVVTVPALPAGNYYAIALVDPRRQIPEVSDFNNTRVSDSSFAIGPDLTVISVNGPGAAGPGELVDFTVRLGSIGAPFAAAANYALFLSDDQVFDPGDRFMGGTSVTFAGLTEVVDTLSLPFPAVVPGDYYVFAQVDPAGRIVEADENNNLRRGQNRIESGPDFYVFSADVDPSIALPGDVITVSHIFVNYGSAYSGPVEYTVYLSEDSSLDAQDPRVYDGITVLAGEINSFTVTSTFALGSVRPGDYRALVVLDPRELIAERDEYDNIDDSSSRVVVQGSEVSVAALTSAPVGFVGLPYEVEVEAFNSGALEVQGLQVETYLSGVGVLLQGVALGRTPGVSIPPGQGRTVTSTVLIPPGTAPGWYLLGVAVDPDNVILESNERDNLFVRPGGVTIMNPAAELSGRIVSTATAAAPGEPLAITRAVNNTGVADAPSVGVQYVLSRDPQIEVSDQWIGTASTAVPQDGSDLSIDVIDLPAGVPAGTYWLGMILDPDAAVAEVDETNNSVLGPQLVVHDGGLRVLNTVLPQGRVGIEYEVALYALGATQPLGWSVVQGNLPAGVVLDQVTGFLRGTPRTEGRYVFTVQVRSGAPVARAELELNVSSGTVPLRLVPQVPVAGTVGRPYSGQMLAVGGQAPYQFTALRSLPEGLTLALDGRITGTPSLATLQTVRVRVDDSAGATDSLELVFRVLRPDHRVLIAQAPLPLARVDTEYCDPEPVLLSASGGSPPYVWSLVGEPPAGMSLNEAGALCGVPSEAGEHQLSVRVIDAGGIIDTSWFGFEVVAADAFVVRTQQVPDATVGQPFEATLEVWGATEPAVWALDLGALPPGLTLSASGSITGTPSEVGQLAFVVRVTDGRGQTRRQPLSIRVSDPAADAPGGCRCLGGSGASRGALGAWALIGLLLGWGRRRRR